MGNTVSRSALNHSNGSVGFRVESLGFRVMSCEKGGCRRFPGSDPKTA